MRILRLLLAAVTVTVGLVTGPSAHVDTLASRSSTDRARQGGTAAGLDVASGSPSTFGVADVTNHFMSSGKSEPCAAIACASVSGVSTGGTWVSTLSPGVANTAIPEPASLLLFGSGLSVIGAVIRRRMSKSETP